MILSFIKKIDSEISINDEGNVVLPLPFIIDDPILPDNRYEVQFRTKNTLNRLSKNSSKLEQCVSVMGKYIANDHVERISTNEQNPVRKGHAWWIPVFPVHHPRKDKCRIVFDSSANYHGTSLNEQLLPGPDSNNRLKDVLIGFRHGSIGFSADVEAMFHNFYLKPNERDYTRFYWFKDNDPSQEVCQYRAKVHIFGNRSSPALATLGLRYAATQTPSKDHVVDFVMNQFYVDDGLSCSNSHDEAIKILRDTKEALALYNIRLHKICSSSSEVLAAFPESELATNSMVKLEDCSLQTALGLNWDTKSDLLVIRSDIAERPFTRRGVLATVNSGFDPLGICSPIILTGKHIQRTLLKAQNDPKDLIAWDQELSHEHKDIWESWKRSLRELSGMFISRAYFPPGLDWSNIELHGFCDASCEGSGFVIYIRAVNSADVDKSHVSFVTACSKIIPQLPPTIPRLELCSALDLSIVMYEVSNKLHIPVDKVYLYSDSMITLG